MDLAPDDKIFDSLIDRHVLSMPGRIVESAWLGHIPFAKWLVGIHRPNITVELGVHNGASLCAMAEAANDIGHVGSFHGVDHWIGDAHAGSHTVDVYWNLKAYLTERSLDRVELKRMSFQDALPHFKDGSVDLLHIDGLHTYEAVKDDFETWLPKLSARGIIMFHDIRVIDNNFGVWRLWDEVSKIYPAFDFDHSYGLGVIYVGSDPMSPWIERLMTNRSTILGQSFRNYFSTIGSAIVTEQIQRTRTIEISALKDELHASRDLAHRRQVNDHATARAVEAMESVVSLNEEKIRTLRNDNDMLRTRLAVAEEFQANAVIAQAELGTVDATTRILKSELDAVRRSRDAIIAERNSVLVDNDTTVLARQALEVELEAVRSDRDASLLAHQALAAELDAARSDKERAEARHGALLQWSVAFHDSTAASLSWKLTRPLRWLNIGRPKRPGPPPDGSNS